MNQNQNANNQKELDNINQIEQPVSDETQIDNSQSHTT